MQKPPGQKTRASDCRVQGLQFSRLLLIFLWYSIETKANNGKGTSTEILWEKQKETEILMYFRKIIPGVPVPVHFLHLVHPRWTPQGGTPLFLSSLKAKTRWKIFMIHFHLVNRPSSCRMVNKLTCCVRVFKWQSNLNHSENSETFLCHHSHHHLIILWGKHHVQDLSGDGQPILT